MNGFAFYVWPSFSLALLIMAALLIASLRAQKQAERALAMLQETPGDET